MSNSSSSSRIAKETSWEDTDLSAKDESMEDGVDQPEVQPQVGLQFPDLDGYGKAKEFMRTFLERNFYTPSEAGSLMDLLAELAGEHNQPFLETEGATSHLPLYWVVLIKNHAKKGQKYQSKVTEVVWCNAGRVSL